MVTIMKTVKTQAGNEIKLLGNNPHKDILVIGVFHGDEPQGNFLINEYLKSNPETNLLFINCLNPDGMARGTRTNLSGVDINRNFPTANWSNQSNGEFYGGKTPASESETQFIIEIINEYNPQIILTFHAPYKVVNYDGPAEKIAEKISKIINYPTEKNIGYPTPGSFGTYCGIERNIPTITLELDENCCMKDLIPPVFKILNLLETI